MKKYMKIIAFILLLAICIPFVACVSGNNDIAGGDDDGKTDNEKQVSVLRDKKFRQGFLVRGLGKPIYDDPIETFGEAYDPNVYFNYDQKGLKPSWRLCQWATRYPFHDKNNSSTEIKDGKATFNYKFTDKGNGEYLYENQSKTVGVNTKTGEYRLALKSSECYKYDRTAGQEWPHLLLEQYLCTPSLFVPETKISDSQSVRVTLDCKINSFKDNMGDRADYSLHSCMCLFYLFVANYDEKANVFTDMLWFGIPVFDNRYTFSEEQSFPDTGSKESATDKWIFNIASSNFFNPDYNLYDVEGNILYDTWRTVDVELIHLIRKAFNEAQKQGYMQNSSWENLYVNGMYTGYECPGNYDIDMSFKNIDIIMEKK